MISRLRNLIVGEEGQDIVEYALLVSLIAVVSILALSVLGFEVWANWITIRGAISGAV